MLSACGLRRDGRKAQKVLLLLRTMRDASCRSCSVVPLGLAVGVCDRHRLSTMRVLQRRRDRLRHSCLPSLVDEN